jgi:adenylosuccinate synthase
MGIGETRGDRISGLWFDGSDIASIYGRDKLFHIKDYKLEQCRDFVNNEETISIYRSMEMTSPASVWEYYKEWFKSVRWGGWHDITIENPNAVVFEGAQGMLLDEIHGFGKHITWSDCTFNGALSIINQYGARSGVEITKIGVVRSYFTRHGAGPFITEVSNGAIKGITPWKNDHNTNNEWQASLRIGYFDAMAFKYALNAIGNVDALAITHIDALKFLNKWVYCDGYLDEKGNFTKKLTQDMMSGDKKYSYSLISTNSIINKVEKLSGVPVRYLSTGNTWVGKSMLAENNG